METQCNGVLFDFQAQNRRDVVATFDGGIITTDGGAMLLRAKARSTGLNLPLLAPTAKAAIRRLFSLAARPTTFLSMCSYVLTTRRRRVSLSTLTQRMALSMAVSQEDSLSSQATLPKPKNCTDKPARPPVYSRTLPGKRLTAGVVCVA